jgi:hypothetical protein
MVWKAVEKDVADPAELVSPEKVEAFGDEKEGFLAVEERLSRTRYVLVRGISD